MPARAAIAKMTQAEVPPFVRADEVRRACDTLGDARPRERALVRFLWVTGARISEALAVRVHDVDFAARFVTVPTLKRRKPMARTVPLPSEFLGELAVLVNVESLAREASLFGWKRTRSWEVVRSALLAAGVEDERAHPHALRHGHCVHALEGGTPLNVLARAVGHANVATTSIYLSATGADVRRFYERIDW